MPIILTTPLEESLSLTVEELLPRQTRGKTFPNTVSLCWALRSYKTEQFFQFLSSLKKKKPPPWSESWTQAAPATGL